MTREEWIDKFKLFLSLQPDMEESISPTDRLLAERACIASFEAGYAAAQSLSLKDRACPEAHGALLAAFECGSYSHIVDAEEGAKVPDKKLSF